MRTAGGAQCYGHCFQTSTDIEELSRTPHNLPTPTHTKEAEQKGDLLSCKDGGGGTGTCSALEANSPVHSTGSYSWEQLLRGKASLGDVKACVLCVVKRARPLQIKIG